MKVGTLDRDLQSHQQLGAGAQEDSRVVHGLGAVGMGRWMGSEGW